MKKKGFSTGIPVSFNIVGCFRYSNIGSTSAANIGMSDIGRKKKNKNKRRYSWPLYRLNRQLLNRIAVAGQYLRPPRRLKYG